MKNFSALLIACCFLTAQNVLANDVFSSRRADWMQIAEKNKPELIETVVKPVTIVNPVTDTNVYQNWKYEAVDGLQDFYSKNFKEINTITLDFGKHITGYLTFNTHTLNRCLDAPIRLRLTFGEMPAELNTPLDPWKGTLGRGWMQDEVVTLMQTDKPFTIERRLSGRYLKIELLGMSDGFDFSISDVTFKAVSSAGEVKTVLQPNCPEMVRRINDVGIETLRECMQTIYEDGPKRDRRLWAGDAYLQALANRYSFQNHELTKRCLYLFAGLSQDNGLIISNVFESPEPHPQYGSYLINYCLLWNSSLLEYLNDTGDITTGQDLWELAKVQMEDAISYVGKDNIFDISHRPTWIFFDWRDGLDVNMPIQAATIFALKQTYELAKKLGREKEVSNYPQLAKKMTEAARKKYFDKKQGLLVSGANNQVSVVSQSWGVISGILNQKEGKIALKKALASTNSVKPGTPYATHYLIEAMVKCGMNTEAHDYLIDYWGGMIKKGADTFWEAYDPNDDCISPYNFFPVNSSCHAWSCTPVYFIHKYPEIFQK